MHFLWKILADFQEDKVLEIAYSYFWSHNIDKVNCFYSQNSDWNACKILLLSIFQTKSLTGKYVIIFIFPKKAANNKILQALQLWNSGRKNNCATLRHECKNDLRIKRDNLLNIILICFDDEMSHLKFYICISSSCGNFYIHLNLY